MIDNDNLEELKYLLGILNSKITTFYVSKVASSFRGGYYAFGKSSLQTMPLPTLNFSKKYDKLLHEKMVLLVEKMLTLNKTLVDTKVPNEKERIQRQIDATDKQVDILAYELYGLTDNEIQIMENCVEE